MLACLARNWWVLALRGLVAILFAIAAIVWPELTLVALVLIFGAYALVDGAFALVTGFRADRSDVRWPLIVEGIAGVVAGLIALFAPTIAALALVFLIAAWAIITGIFEIIAAVRLREQIDNEWLLAAMGVVSIVFGVLLAIAPAAGALALIWVIAGYALVFGILMLVLAFRLRGLQARGGESIATPA